MLGRVCQFVYFCTLTVDQVRHVRHLFEHTKQNVIILVFYLFPPTLVCQTLSHQYNYITISLKPHCQVNVLILVLVYILASNRKLV